MGNEIGNGAAVTTAAVSGADGALYIGAMDGVMHALKSDGTPSGLTRSPGTTCVQSLRLSLE